MEIKPKAGFDEVVDLASQLTFQEREKLITELQKTLKPQFDDSKMKFLERIKTTIKQFDQKKFIAI